MPASPMQIRAANAADLPVIQEIARRTIDKCYRRFLGDESVDWFINSGESDRELHNHIDTCDVLLEDNAPIAFAVYFHNLIHLMMVDVDRHRQGIGTRLLAHCEQRLGDRGHDRLRLETFEGNQQAINFYRRNRWVVTSKRVDKDHGFIRVYFEKDVS